MWWFLFWFASRHCVASGDTGNKERPRPIASGEARQSPNNSNEPGRKYAVRAVALLFVEIGDFTRQRYKHPEGPGYVKSSHSKEPCTSFFVDDGNTKLIDNILLRALFFNFQTGFFGSLRAGCADFLPFAAAATKNQTFFVLISPEKSFFVKKVSSRLYFLLKILYVYVSIIYNL